jgi:AbrB family looped-hinge helix DNA binding protein
LSDVRTKVTTRGRVSIPSAVRKRLQIKPETVLEWIVEGSTARVIPLPDDPIATLRGAGRKGEVRRLLVDRRADRRHDG